MQGFSVTAPWIDLLGLLAGTLVFSAFYMRCMVKLRVSAILGNVAFLSYGLLLHLWPIVLLHMLLLPINVMRLAQLRLPQRV